MCITHQIQSFVSQHAAAEITGNCIIVPSKNLCIQVLDHWSEAWHPQCTEQEKAHVKRLEQMFRARNYENWVVLYEHDWLRRPNLIRSFLRSKLGATATVYARKCNIVHVDQGIAADFFNQTHLHYHSAADSYIGLEYKQQLVQCASFSAESNGMHVHRISTALDTTVVGGVGRMLAHINNQHPQPLLVRAMRDLSSANAYEKLGFVPISTSVHEFDWVSKTELHSSHLVTVDFAKELLPAYDCTLSIAANMFAAGYRRLWNNGSVLLTR